MTTSESAPTAPPRKPPKSRQPSGLKDERHASFLILGGWIVVVTSFVIGCALIIVQNYFIKDHPYFSLVTYSGAPAGISIGAALIVVGILLRWRRRRRGTDKPLPVIDLNSRQVHVVIIAAAGLLTIFVSVSGVASYQAFHFTESAEFCGEVCHQVMTPEYDARGRGAHARVGCAECHIGPGAEWFVQAKLSGLRQVYQVLANTYELPIKVPLANLRPARDTCEECHWPAKFEGSAERVLWRFWYDKNNTPSRFHLLMRVGGVNPGSGRPEGIHWHSNSRDAVTYWSPDYTRAKIPWVEVVRGDGTHTIYSDGSLKEAPPKAEMRVMDCIDCHNRPAHTFPSPAVQVDRAMGERELPREVPYMKRTAVRLLSGPYRSRAEAQQGITDGIKRQYATMPMEEQQKLIEKISELYNRVNFPDQGVNWATYINHIGHKTSLGCFRCHDGKHVDDKGEKIPISCDNYCHDFVHQAHGEAAYGPVTYQRLPFEHPGDVSVKAREEDQPCAECHDPSVGWYPGTEKEKARLLEAETSTPAAQAPKP